MTTKRDLVSKMQNGTDVEAADRPPNVFDLIRGQKDQFVMALNDEAGAKRLTRILVTEIRSNPRLGECTSVSLLGAAMQCAQHNLDPGPLGHSYLVPIWNGKLKAFEVEWWLGYQGMMELARRSGRIRSLEADDVRPNDTFRVIKGSNAKFDHEINYRESRGGSPYAYYAYAKLDEGHQTPMVLTPDEVNSFRERSSSWRFAETGPKAKGGGKKNSPWHTDYRAMALKTCVRRLFTWLPMSVELNEALAADGQVSIATPEEPAPLPRQRDFTEVDELPASDPFTDIADTQPSASVPVDAAVRGEAEASVALDGETQSVDPPQADTEKTYSGAQLRSLCTGNSNRSVTVPKALRAIQAEFPDAGFAELDLVAADPQGTDWLLAWIKRGGKTEGSETA